MLDLDAIDVDEVATALADQTDQEHRWVIDPRSGEVVLWTSDTGIDGEHAAGQGCFSALKNELYQGHPELISVWQARRKAGARVRAVQWLADQGLVEGADVQRFERDHPEPSLQRSP